MTGVCFKVFFRLEPYETFPACNFPEVNLLGMVFGNFSIQEDFSDPNCSNYHNTVFKQHLT